MRPLETSNVGALGKSWDPAIAVRSKKNTVELMWIGPVFETINLIYLLTSGIVLIPLVLYSLNKLRR